MLRAPSSLASFGGPATAEAARAGQLTSGMITHCQIVDHAEPRIALTDSWLSPLFAGADMVLPSTLTAPVPFDALTPALTLTKALIDAISDQFGTLAFDADVRRRRRE